MCSAWQRCHFWRRERCFIHWSRGDVFGWRILFCRRLFLSKSKCFITLCNYIYIYYIYNYVSYTYFTVYVEVCVFLEIFRLTSGVSLFVRGAHVMWFMRRYYKEKVIYEDIFSVPIIQNVYKSYRVSFLGGESRNAPSPVRAKFRCR